MRVNLLKKREAISSAKPIFQQFHIRIALNPILFQF